MPISKLVWFASALMLTTFMAVIVIREYHSWELEIGGRQYENIVEAKDIMADVLPPPLYLIEAYSEVAAAYLDPAKVEASKDLLRRHKADYDRCVSQWRKRKLPDHIATAIFTQSHSEATAFWSVVLDRFLPALAKNDQEAQKRAYADLRLHFEKHKQIVLMVVPLIEGEVRNVEKRAADIDFFMKFVVYGVTGLSVMAVLALQFMLGKFVSRPLSEIAERTRSLADGQLDAPIPFADQRNEIGRISAALAIFRSSAVEKKQLEAAAQEARRHVEAERSRVADEQTNVVNSLNVVMDCLSKGDLTCRINANFPIGYQALKDNFNSAISELELTVAAVKTGTFGIRTGSIEIAQATNDLARRTESQAASLEETAASVDQITKTVKNTADSTGQAHDVVSVAKVEAEKGGEIVLNATQAMNAIEASSREIGQIIGVIDEIAFQTNLLALNAGVEAARAGDAGRGFAVVASEVRALAQRAADAARQIKQLISASAAQVGVGVGLVASTGLALERISASVIKINSVITDIAAGAREQSLGLQQVNMAVGQMDQVTQQNAAMVEEATAATRSLADQADQLSVLVDRFTTSAHHLNGAKLEHSSPRSFPARDQKGAKLTGIIGGKGRRAVNADWTEF